jgi:hypothetical protein
MSKLLTEPRGKMELTDVKKKKRVKKEPTEPVEVRYTLLHESDKRKVNELFRIYKDNPYNARVKYFNAKEKIHFDRLVIFEKGLNDFEICEFTNSFGISITNRMYSGQKKNSSIVYKGGKFWSITRRGKGAGVVRPLTWGTLINFIQETESINSWGNNTYDRLKKSKVFTYLYAKFPWMKMLSEHSMSMGVNLNVVKEKKLFKYKDLTKHIMKVPNDIAEMVVDSRAFGHLRNAEGRPVKGWTSLLKDLENVQCLTKEMLDCHYFMDSCKMARTLGKKVNCKWSLKRLKDEHDTWARIIGNIVLDCEETYDLAIRPEFLAFAEFTGYRLLMTNKDMLIEGMMQNHCVGTYIDKVNKGDCAIFSIEGYTLQVGIEKKRELLRGFFDLDGNGDPIGQDAQIDAWDGFDDVAVGDEEIRLPQSKHHEFKVFKNLQFRGKHNVSAPPELVEKVQTEFDKFKAAGKFNDLPTNYKPSDRPVNNQLGWAVMNMNNNALPF